MTRSTFLTTTAAALMSLLATPTRAEPLALGAALPAITATLDDGTTADLAQAGAAGWTLVYFYPKADTPGCTAQACSLRDAYADLTAKNVRVYGVSRDGVEAQKAFREKYQLPFPLVADPDGKVVAAFGVPSRGTFASRQAFLFRDGRLVWLDTSASTKEQAADVLAVLASPPA